jgi:peroxiredoxin
MHQDDDKGGHMLNVGDSAPKLTVTGTDGEIDLGSAFAEGPVVLYFFPKAFTSG